jgi:hypothetical protein
MTSRASTFFAAAALSALALAGCKGKPDQANSLASLDNQLVGNDADPAVTAALNDQITTDRNLANQSNRNAVRPPETPTQAQYPKPDAHSSASAAGAPCASARFENGLGWAQRLSPAFPLYPGARVTEAAGSDSPACRIRVVSFTTGDGWQRVVEHYRGRAVQAGYSAEHQLRDGDHVLGGANPNDGGAYYLIVTPAQNGSDVSLIANNGR